MKFTIDKLSLLRELAYIQQSVIEKKSLTPALAHVRVEAAGKRTIRLTGTDLDQTLTCETEGTVQKAGSCALPARKLLEIVKNLPDAPVQIETKANDRTEVTCARANFRIAGLDPKDLPELPKFKESAVQLPADVVRQMIERTRFSITQDESRYTLAGAKFILRKKGVRMVTTDGHRLSLIDNKSVTGSKELDCLIPKKALIAVSNLAAAHEGAVGISVDENHIYFEIGARTLISRLLAGQFPNYEMILPKANDNKVRFECADLLQTVRRVSVMTDERSRAICLEFTRKKLRVFSEGDEQGAAEETLDIAYEGAPVVIGLNASYLVEYLSVVGSGALSFEFKSAREVVQILPVGEAGYNSFALIMPMALGDTVQPAPAAKAPDAEADDAKQEEPEALPEAA
ncbi:MAG: DNA polymerase III subunit beta [Pyrinomonadaceae bacterium]